MADIIKCVSIKGLESGSNRIFMLGEESLKVGDIIPLLYRDKGIEQYEVTDIFELSSDIKMNHFVIPIVVFPKTKRVF